MTTICLRNRRSLNLVLAARHNPVIGSDHLSRKHVLEESHVLILQKVELGEPRNAPLVASSHGDCSESGSCTGRVHLARACSPSYRFSVHDKHIYARPAT
eukprot:5697574-Amphidinium_carterae.1